MFNLIIINVTVYWILVSIITVLVVPCLWTQVVKCNSCPLVAYCYISRQSEKVFIFFACQEKIKRGREYLRNVGSPRVRLSASVHVTWINESVRVVMKWVWIDMWSKTNVSLGVCSERVFSGWGMYRLWMNGCTFLPWTHSSISLGATILSYSLLFHLLYYPFCKFSFLSFTHFFLVFFRSTYIMFCLEKTCLPDISQY